MPSKKQKTDASMVPVSAQDTNVSLEEFEALKTQLAELQAKSDEYLEGWKRALADYDNLKKRIERDRIQDIQNIKADIIKEFLPVVDDLELALQNRPADSVGGAWAGGIELIVRKLHGILQAEGLQRIEAEGQPFDPTFHEAISQEQVDGMESGIVIGVVKNGYTIGEDKRVIRPAVVRVSA